MLQPGPYNVASSVTYAGTTQALETVYPDGKKAEYRYDEALRLSQLTDSTNAVRYTYDANSQLSAK